MIASKKEPNTLPTRTEITKELRAGKAGEISPAARAMLDERKAINVVAQEMSNLSWGKALPDLARRAIAEYCRRYNIDAATEIDILGGRVYRNANYFIRRGTELRNRGLIRNVVVEHINADPRLDELAKEAGEFGGRAKEEIARRKWLRVAHNIPEQSKGAVLITILPASGAPVVGANYAGSFGNRKDPVGDENPGKTAETRAYRRAWRHLIDTMPQLRAEEGEINDEGKSVSSVIVDVVGEDLERTAKIASGTMNGVPIPEDGDYYGDGAMHAERLQIGATQPDPYADEDLLESDQKLVADEELALGDEPPTRRRSPQSEGR